MGTARPLVHESTDLALADRRRVDGIPITGPHRLAMDLGSVVSPKAYRQAMRGLRSQHGVEVDGGRWYRLDLAFPDLKIAIEVDGSQHEERPAQVADAGRTAALKAAGWTVERVRAKTFAADLLRAIAVVQRAILVPR